MGIIEKPVDITAHGHYFVLGVERLMMGGPAYVRLVAITPGVANQLAALRQHTDRLNLLGIQFDRARSMYPHSACIHCVGSRDEVFRRLRLEACHVLNDYPLKPPHWRRLTREQGARLEVLKPVKTHGLRVDPKTL